MTPRSAFVSDQQPHPEPLDGRSFPGHRGRIVPWVAAIACALSGCGEEPHSPEQAAKNTGPAVAIARSGLDSLTHEQTGEQVTGVNPNGQTVTYIVTQGPDGTWQLGTQVTGIDTGNSLVTTSFTFGVSRSPDMLAPSTTGRIRQLLDSKPVLQMVMVTAISKDGSNLPYATSAPGDTERAGELLQQAEDCLNNSPGKPCNLPPAESN